MPITIDGETYYTAKEAAKYLGISRPTFYTNVASELIEYKYGALKRVYYRQSDLDKYKGIRVAEQQKDDEDK